ncbi:1-hydroxycarotenoid 3,4-desaturase CrtD [Mucilaginibacter sp. KACC 22063]|uniref:1-hydroxycarotenoid 3,4-desaturase CrtD n=1 Tax=Mucilaginibacter sp. KACC 22063 TaxID=3025666 RepID=UPI0023663696|nr:1-hydroxycarotenoid 3,4-desaturase CrtD [Mucilaginibacter sp. KACC 22063]WDF56310.1 phytoene desaturase family protein [Mucilaginibacter sp. KACC 22063]
MPQQKALIIGAGIAGIATSIRLVLKGYRVEVFEANTYPGGKLTSFEQDGYRFDAGPSLFTMPQYVDELFKLAGKDPRAHFNYQKLETVCQYFYEDGTSLTAYAEEDQLAKSVADATSEPENSIRRFLQYSKRIYDVTNHVFLEKSLHRLRTYFNLKTSLSVLRLFQIDALRTMNNANQSFFKDKRMVQFFNRYATYNGSNPYRAPATLNVIPHLEQHYGAWFPQGGMQAITDSLVSLAESLGVKFHYQSPVEEILLKGRRAVGVQVNGEIMKGDILVSNMDVWFTYKKLLSNQQKLHPRKILQQERSSSALIFYWGIKKSFPKLDLHNIFFSADYREEFSQIWQQKTIGNDPTVYVNISSKYKQDDAPEGQENWFVMINVPANSGQDWDVLIEEARQNIISKLSRLLKEDVAALITCESILDPRSIEGKTSSYQGSLYGTSSNNRFAAFLRHANRSNKVKNLYFCGGSVHPGGGIPLALLSAKIVSEWV